MLPVDYESLIIRIALIEAKVSIYCNRDFFSHHDNRCATHAISVNMWGGPRHSTIGQTRTPHRHFVSDHAVPEIMELLVDCIVQALNATRTCGE